jgi:hypothetical protein
VKTGALSYLAAWARVRRITAGRHASEGVTRYTTIEALRADFGDRSGTYELAISLWYTSGPVHFGEA